MQAFRAQGGREKHKQKKEESTNKYHAAPFLEIGKVVQRYADGTVDVVLNRGGILQKVLVGHEQMATDAGEHYIPDSKRVNTTPSKDNYDVPTPTKVKDIYCVIAYVEGKARMPIVLTFLTGPASQLVGQVGLQVEKHESGVYSTIDTNATHEMVYPDGTSIVVSSTETKPKDMKSINKNWSVPTGKPVTITINHSSGYTITLGKNSIEIGGKTPIARKGDQVQVNVGGTVYTGTITGGSTVVTSG